MRKDFTEPFLDFYDVDGGLVWCWKKSLAGGVELSSQEFSSQESAVEAWINNNLVWEELPSE